MIISFNIQPKLLLSVKTFQKVKKVRSFQVVTSLIVVDEVVSLSCFSHHFPYFKTAPAGWKNSVRHNLSLNKCFEKIEKPHSSGSSGSQRKGCLWAMNPAKISKMDDEVAKWSRKDPSAIKKAMVCPGTVKPAFTEL